MADQDNQTAFAKMLTDHLQDDGIAKDLTYLELLDALAVLDLKLTQDPHGDSGVAYISDLQASIEERKDQDSAE